MPFLEEFLLHTVEIADGTDGELTDLYYNNASWKPLQSVIWAPTLLLQQIIIKYC